MATYNPNGRNAMRPDENRSREEDRAHETERHGQGQSGYGAGRDAEDRAYQSRNQSWYGRDDRDRGIGTDDRFERGRGGAEFGNERGMERGRTGSPQHGLERTDRDFGRGPQGSDRGLRYDEGSGQDGGVYQRVTGGMQGQQRGLHRGKGPQGYTRSDDRIKESVCEALTEDEHLDASHIEVVVKDGEVILTGTVEDRHAKRCAEDIAERQSGVKDVQNNLRVGDRNQRGNQSSGSTVSKNETDTSSLTDKKPRA